MSLSAQLGRSVRDAALARHTRAIRRVEALIDRRVPVDTGYLKSSRRVTTIPTPISIFTTLRFEAPYARWVDEGPRPHVIRARYARALRFRVGGKVLYRRKVNWRPGPGVARNRGWFSRNVTRQAWHEALEAAR